MIVKNDNILEDEKIKRIVDYNPNDKQITFLDSRFYERNGKYYPSITYVLGYIPKNKIFLDWLVEKGDDSERIVREASDRGKIVHGSIEALLKGKELEWIGKDGEARYNLDVWQMLIRFKEFWQIHQPKLIGSEIHVFSDKYEIAGTIDLILEILGETWLIDIKTSNHLPKVYNYQLAAYQQCWSECYDKPIQRRGILWLKSATRKEDKTGKKIQGKNCTLVECDRTFEQDFESFKLAHSMYKHEAEYDAPLSTIFPTSIKL